ncbi:hypothetical protein LZ578_09290 [Jeotgalibaca sp. MA1X17-3]|uniref:hypothetical protein n=1 Tax=Jeotgalibaca sp. MA1X17-3 TaxID=2908211 RepID=UPI001F475FC2|nr:hypothetical protein [Jeotgalibaca sp. MA1X17-3]UJF15180.1 hypothetical protein LZ578_09290 [Jeotgalibaca sp. MA1X17-3]
MKPIQYQSDFLNNEKKQYKKPVPPRSFPNYLVSDSEETNDPFPNEVNQSEPNSPFIAESVLDATSAVPFIQHNQKRFSQHQEKNERPKSSHFTEGKRRADMEKRDSKSYSYYRSRRPFKVTEVPSLWKTDFVERKKQVVDYEKIKQELMVPTEELIFLENTPVETR